MPAETEVAGDAIAGAVQEAPAPSDSERVKDKPVPVSSSVAVDCPAERTLQVGGLSACLDLEFNGAVVRVRLSREGEGERSRWKFPFPWRGLWIIAARNGPPRRDGCRFCLK